MWEISNSLQLSGFLRSIALGMLLCALYDVFSALRKSGFNSVATVLVHDIIYFFLSAPIIFLFLLATTNGQIRLYALIGTAIGFIGFKLSLSKLLVFLLSRLFLLLKFVFSNLSRGISAFFGLIQKYTGIILKNIKKFSKKALFSSKKA